ncbi:hypothetical protein QR680_000216 [Steinernema hermaphroditum]|uniref:Protein CLP1 homolog n=1 Tax=Steinernema hermaphroditum TaxID=289476 RepID=A0AA39GUM1_9BILA|nr:hypothetical protein QR680_000216 [Steinernema hermaphroditum]
MVEQFTLKEDNELRFDVVSEDVAIELCSGRAEVFGTELKQNEKYVFLPGMRVAVFSWTGATIEISGSASNAYVAESNHPMILYLNTHEGMEQIRVKARADLTGKTRGPRTMVVGPTDVGKSTVCRILTNYAVRMGHTPMYVDVDVGQGNVSVAGTIGALMIDRTADPVYGFDDRCAKVFQFGDKSPGTNIPLYDRLVEELAKMVSLLTPVVGFVKIVHHPKSGGVEARSPAIRSANRTKSFHKYFYGTRQISYNPFRIVISFDDLIIAKIGTERLPESCMPHGMKTTDHRMMVVRIEPSAKLVNHVVAITEGFTVVDQSLLSAVAIGFIVIVDVSVENRQLSITCPQPSFPEGTTVGLLSDVTFTDDEVRVH